MNRTAHAHPRAGTSLLEIIIATAVLGTIAAMTIEFTMSARSSWALSSAQDEIAEDVERITQAMSADFAVSGWALSATASFAGGTTLPTASTADRTAARYFPYVITYGGSSEDSAVTGGGFTHAQISASVLPDQAAQAVALNGSNTIPTPTGWNSYRSAQIGTAHALVFLRMQQGTWTSSPINAPATQLKFGARDDSDLTTWSNPDNQDALGILKSTPFVESYSATVPIGVFTRISSVSSTTAYGISQDSLVLKEQNGQFTLLPQWETIDPPMYDGTDGNDPAGAQYYKGWREYMYAVVRPPSSSAGRLGRLVRAHKVRLTAGLVSGVEVGQLITTTGQEYGFVVNRILSDNVLRVVFETSRSAPAFVAPPINQVRVSITMLRPLISMAELQARIPRQFTFSFALRTEASSTIKSETTLTADSVITSAPHPNYPVTP